MVTNSQEVPLARSIADHRQRVNAIAASYYCSKVIARDRSPSLEAQLIIARCNLQKPVVIARRSLEGKAIARKGNSKPPILFSRSLLGFDTTRLLGWIIDWGYQAA